MEFVLVPSWLKVPMRNLNCQSYTELTESIVRYLGNEQTNTERLPFKKEKEYNMSVLYPVAEGSEAEVLESGEVNERVPPTDEHDGDVESDDVLELDGVITREELSESQRNNDTLKHIRDKAGINKEPYFWHKGVLMRKPCNILGKDLIVVAKVARSRILKMTVTTRRYTSQLSDQPAATTYPNYYK